MNRATLARWQKSPTSLRFNAYCVFAAFSTYFCMYAFRKPFLVGAYAGKVHLPLLPEIDHKIILIIAQVIGYTLSKFIGIKVVSEAGAKRRAASIVAMIAFAEVCLLGFALVPAPFDILFLFLNGIPLGMIWGLVFGYLEGRRSSEILGVGLSASYIVASGAVKSAGQWILNLGIAERWMPFATGLVFFPAFLLCVQLLRTIPPPNAEDVKFRTARVPMDATERKRFFRMFAPGLVTLTGVHVFLTAYRDFRDNFAREIWQELGYGGQPAIFTVTELPIAFIVLVVLGALMIVRDNKKAVTVVHALMLAGTALVGFATAAFQAQLISPVVWMTAVGLGMYVAYVPYGCILFDRIIAATGFAGTAGFMMYVTDAFGYLGSVALTLFRNLGHPELNWLVFFTRFSYAVSIVAATAFLFSLIYFRRSHRVKSEARA
ncbi:MAG: hypothetical protein HYW49_11440 [Deltaproteobacteria bacterium]|nr:hypothetical protein [Deltaproteobacteria bacterium]